MKKLLLKFSLLALVVTTAILSCKKEEDSNLIIANATVIDAGPIATDGCGWLLKLDTVTYSPTNLPDKFKVADAKVTVNYNLLKTRTQCGLAAHLGYTQIDIKNIKSR